MKNFKIDPKKNLYYTYVFIGRKGENGKPEYKKIRAKTKTILEEKINKIGEIN